MPTIRELGLLADAVYSTNPAVPGWACPRHQAAVGAMNGFQAVTFVKEGATVLAFRGTAQAVDAVADLRLGCGMNSGYFAAAEAYAEFYQNYRNVYVCGHSLGGAIAQVVANRAGYRFVSFNAPGVAVFASRNLLQADATMTAIRSVGMVVGAIEDPRQAWRDVRSTFNTVRGLNVCLENDAVSRIGIHYGDVIRIPGTSSNPLTEHRMTTMNTVLARNAVGERDIVSL